MLRRAFLKRMAIAVLGSGMLADVLIKKEPRILLLSPDRESEHYYSQDFYGLGYRYSKKLLEDDYYKLVNKVLTNKNVWFLDDSN